MLHQPISVQAPIVTLNVTSEAASSERRFDRSLTLPSLKERLEPLTGVPTASMKLTAFTANGERVCALDDDSKMLGYYPLSDYMRLHVEDTNPHKTAGMYTDLSLVEKYEMPTAEYEKRQDSVLAFKQRNKLGRFAASESTPSNESEEFREEASKIQVGDRCKVETEQEGGLAKLGTVRFVGKTQFKPGYWVGVEYDEPVGKHDGTCQSKHGAFVRPNKLTIGDFPEEDLLGEEEI
ncbi:CAP Gly-rich domain-containing protein [Zopfochytrium polystomum]|nr:CAP Gly-rich domain-containing protein [Zopfochytrium polystomum]